MATKQEVISRAKEIIASYPTAGKAKVNAYLKAEYGVGLRSATVLKLKSEVAKEQPQLAPELYQTGGYKPTYRAIYNQWIKGGFTRYEARELTLGGGRLTVDGSRRVLNSIPGQAAIRTRQDWIQARLKDGWTKKQIRQRILEDYKRHLGTFDKFGKPYSPWSNIRAEYLTKAKISKKQYKEMMEKRQAKKERRQQSKTRKREKELRHPLSDKR